MRLSDQQLETIRSLVARMVPAESQYELILFGSRLNDRARGGDVDLYLETTGLCQWPIILAPFRPIKLTHLGRQKSALAFVLQSIALSSQHEDV